MRPVPALEARDLSFVYSEGTRALDGVDFIVNEQDFVALLASNGSGKTTLIKLLVGLLKPRSGTVRLRGGTLRDMPPREIFSQVGVVLQNPRDQLFGPTVADDIGFGPRNLGVDEREVEKRIGHALDAVGLSGVRDRAVHHLSFGQQKRVCVAGALAMRSEILILDEPTAGLDPVGEAQMIRLLHRLNSDNGKTVVLATHSVDLLPLFANRVVVLSEGRVSREGTPERVFAEPGVLNAAGLRMPYISHLFDELRTLDGLRVDELPLTIGEARRRLLELIAEQVIEGRNAQCGRRNSE